MNLTENLAKNNSLGTRWCSHHCELSSTLLFSEVHINLAAQNSRDKDAMNSGSLCPLVTLSTPSLPNHTNLPSLTKALEVSAHRQCLGLAVPHIPCKMKTWGNGILSYPFLLLKTDRQTDRQTHTHTHTLY